MYLIFTPTQLPVPKQYPCPGSVMGYKMGQCVKQGTTVNSAALFPMLPYGGYIPEVGKGTQIHGLALKMTLQL
jgi:hypothetical protein